MRRPAALLIVILSAGAVHGESGRTAATTLTRTQSAAPTAQGGAYTAVSGTLDGIAYNPASAATLPRPEVQATYLRGVAQDALGSLRYAHSLGFGAIFAGLDYYDAGTIDVNLSDGTQGMRRAQQDAVGSVGFALGRRIPISIGGTVKFYRFELAEESKASGVAFDAGALWRTPVTGLNLGASATNAGAEVRFEEQGDPLPVTGRGGLAYTVDFARYRRLRAYPYQVRVSVDGVSERNEGASVRAGLEITRSISDALVGGGQVALRGGYQAEPETASVGLGVRLGGFGVDYALNFLNDIDGNTHRATVSWRFLSRADAVTEGGEPQPVRRRRNPPPVAKKNGEA